MRGWFCSDWVGSRGTRNRAQVCVYIYIVYNYGQLLRNLLDGLYIHFVLYLPSMLPKEISIILQIYSKEPHHIQVCRPIITIY